MLVESYAKSLVGIRDQPSKIQIFGSNYQLKFISSEDFTSKILPAMQKSMLRNPEIVYESKPAHRRLPRKRVDSIFQLLFK